jgi:hypothetical protein
MNTEALIACIEAPVAIQLATRGEGLAPSSLRGFGVRFDAKPGVLSLGVIDAQAERFLTALRGSRQLAVNLTHPATFRGLQLKGPLLEIEEPSLDAEHAARSYYAHFVELLSSVGIMPAQCRGFFHSGKARWVRMQPLSMFNQTPGPGAGNAV